MDMEKQVLFFILVSCLALMIAVISSIIFLVYTRINQIQVYFYTLFTYVLPSYVILNIKSFNSMFFWISWEIHKW